MSDTLHAIVSSLGGEMRGDTSAQVKCPCHDDKQASLAIDQTDNGKLLVKCHAGCDQGAVVDALKMRGLWPTSNGKSRSEIVATYDYHDFAGNLLYQVVRKHPKDFRQRRPDGHGGWIWSTKGVEHVPYRLHEFSLVDDVFVVEGEKDADRLFALGIGATCNHGGAGKWRDVHAKHLQGKRVYIIPDNDGPGQQHAQQVAESLQGIAEVVKVLDLPGLPEKGDVSDWLDRGGNAKRLWDIARDAPEWTPGQTEPKPNRYIERMIWGQEMILEALRKGLSASWVVENILPADAILTVIWGPSDTYKSFLFGIDLGASIATGKDWHGRKVRQRNVLYCVGEGQAGAVKRLIAWQDHYGHEHSDGFGILPMPPFVDNPTDADEFIDALKSLDPIPGVIILDTLARTMQGDENFTKDMNAFVNACKRISDETGAMIIVIHHCGKDEARGMRGSYTLKAGADVEIKVKKTSDKKVTVCCEKQKDHERFKPMNFLMTVVDTGWATDEGEPVTSLVPVIDHDPKTETVAKLSGANRIALDALHKALLKHGETAPDGVREQMDMLSATEGLAVHEDHWRNMAYSMGISEGEQDAKKKAFSRARRYLLDNEKIGTWENFYWSMTPGQDGTKRDIVPTCTGTRRDTPL